MNRKLFIFVSLFALSIFGSFNYWLSETLTQSFSKKMKSEIFANFQLQANVLADLIRNDLLAENLREARNKLGRSSISSYVIACSLRRVDGTADQLFGVADADLGGAQEIEVPIYFSKDGQLWGLLRFHLNMVPFNRSLIELQKILSINQAAMFLMLMVVMLALLGFFWKTSSLLESWFEKSLRPGSASQSQSYFVRFWQPMLLRIETIAVQFKALELVIEKIEIKNEEQTKLRQIIHDIKSPLSAISVGLSQLSRGAGSASLIQSGVNRIEDLLQRSISELKSQKGVSGLPVRVCELIATTKSLLPELRALDSNASIEIVTDGDDGHFSAIDIVQFKSNIVNLVQNSLEAADLNAEVKIVFRRAERYNYVVVSDNGKGMAPATVSQLGMVPISENKENSLRSGTGQGLYNVFQTVRSWGGDVRIVSEQNRGTQVIMAFPKAKNSDRDELKEI